MTDDIAGAAAPVSPEQAERFMVRSRLEIGHILEAIMQQREPVTLYFGGAEDFVPSAVVGVDSDSSRLFLDPGPDARLNRRLVERGRAVVVSFQDRVKIQFAIEKIEKVDFDGGPAFRVNLPGSLMKLQRREAFRVQPPANAPVSCTVHGGDGSRFEMRALDVSIGGLRLSGAPPAGEFQPGMRYERCVLSLPDVGTVETSLDVQYAQETTLRDGRQARVWGCSFPRLSAGTETVLQRYVIKVDRERRARLAGG